MTQLTVLDPVVGVDALGRLELADERRLADAVGADDGNPVRLDVAVVPMVAGGERVGLGGRARRPVLELEHRRQAVAARASPPERVAPVHDACNNTHDKHTRGQLREQTRNNARKSRSSRRDGRQTAGPRLAPAGHPRRTARTSSAGYFRPEAPTKPVDPANPRARDACLLIAREWSLQFERTPRFAQKARAPFFLAARSFNRPTSWHPLFKSVAFLRTLREILAKLILKYEAPSGSI